MTTTEGVDRLLAAARDTMAKVTDCWAATPSADGGVSVRVVAPIPGVPGEDDWTIWLATGGGSRKAGEIRRSGRLTLGYQHHPDRAYVALIGRAALFEDRAEIRRRWVETWRVYFPRGPDDPEHGSRQGERRAHRTVRARRLAGAIRFTAVGAPARCGSPVECRLRLSVRPNCTAANRPRRRFRPKNFPDRRRAGASPPLCGCGDA